MGLEFYTTLRTFSATLPIADNSDDSGTARKIEELANEWDEAARMAQAPGV